MSTSRNVQTHQSVFGSEDVNIKMILSYISHKENTRNVNDYQVKYLRQDEF